MILLIIGKKIFKHLHIYLKYDEFLEKVKKRFGFKSPDRIVPIGDALKFDVVWDGINFFEILTKQNISNV